MAYDPYCYPNTNILRNRLGIEDEEELKATEARIASLALFALEDEPLHGPMDEERLKATHRAIFGELYEWAGSYRENVGTMTKGRAGGYIVTYGSSQFVPAEMKRIFRELASEDYLRGLEIERFAQRLAYFYSELDSTHPFREGNSRSLRQFAADLALSAGYELDWEPTGKTEETCNALYRARDFAFNLRKYDQLIRIIRANLKPLQP
jgi:fido (protein-threonine AMPylation protein)